MHSVLALLVGASGWTLQQAQGRLLGMPSAHALGLGDPVKLDERYTLEAHSPNLPQAFREAWLRVLPAPKRSARQPLLATLAAKPLLVKFEILTCTSVRRKCRSTQNDIV